MLSIRQKTCSKLPWKEKLKIFPRSKVHRKFLKLTKRPLARMPTRSRFYRLPKLHKTALLWKRFYQERCVFIIYFYYYFNFLTDQYIFCHKNAISLVSFSYYYFCEIQSAIEFLLFVIFSNFLNGSKN